MPPGQVAQFRRQGEGEQKVDLPGTCRRICRSSHCWLSMMLTVRDSCDGRRSAAPGASRHRHCTPPSMRGAMAVRQCFIAARAWRWLGSIVDGILPEVVRFKAADDVGEGNHLTDPHWIEKRLIKVLMRALAWSLVWLVRWV